MRLRLPRVPGRDLGMPACWDLGWALRGRNTGGLLTGRNIAIGPIPGCKGCGLHSLRLARPLPDTTSNFPRDRARRHVAKDRESPIGSLDVGSWWRSGSIPGQGCYELSVLNDPKRISMVLGEWCKSRTPREETAIRATGRGKIDKNHAFIGFSLATACDALLNPHRSHFGSITHPNS